MRLSTYLSLKRVAVLEASTKREAIDGMLGLLKGNTGIADFGAFSDAIWQREEVLPTGVGLGVGVPHVRMATVRDPLAALGVVHEGVDYGAMDGEPVRILLLIGMPEGWHREYLQYLATASRLFQDAKFRQDLIACQTPEEIWAVVQQR